MYGQDQKCIIEFAEKIPCQSVGIHIVKLNNNILNLTIGYYGNMRLHRYIPFEPLSYAFIFYPDCTSVFICL